MQSDGCCNILQRQDYDQETGPNPATVTNIYRLVTFHNSARLPHLRLPKKQHVYTSILHLTINFNCTSRWKCSFLCSMYMSVCAYHLHVVKCLWYFHKKYQVILLSQRCELQHKSSRIWHDAYWVMNCCKDYEKEGKYHLVMETQQKLLVQTDILEKKHKSKNHRKKIWKWKHK